MTYTGTAYEHGRLAECRVCIPTCFLQVGSRPAASSFALDAQTIVSCSSAISRRRPSLCLASKGRCTASCQTSEV